MLNKMGVVALILLCCISFASAAVNEKKSDVDIIGQFGEYTITPANDFGRISPSGTSMIPSYRVRQTGTPKPLRPISPC